MGKLDSEEKEVLDAFESGKLKGVKNRKREIECHKPVVEATFKKDSRINIRISSKDLRVLQKRALAQGVPYQALVAGILHKFIEGQLAEHTANNVSQ